MEMASRQLTVVHFMSIRQGGYAGLLVSDEFTGISSLPATKPSEQIVLVISERREDLLCRAAPAAAATAANVSDLLCTVATHLPAAILVGKSEMSWQMVQPTYCGLWTSSLSAVAGVMCGSRLCCTPVG